MERRGRLHKSRHELQRRFLSRDFQVLVSTDAGGEGIKLQSAHVMIMVFLSLFHFGILFASF